MFTEEILKNSNEFKESITGRIILIHNTYYDSENINPAYIVIHSDFGKFTITRFWQSPNRKDMPDKIYSKNDYENISSEEVFKKLLSHYSKGLNPLW